MSWSVPQAVSNPSHRSVLEAVSDLDPELPGIIVVGTAEAVTIVHQIALIACIKYVDSECPVFVDGLSQGKIKSCVSRQMSRAITGEEARSVGDIRGSPRLARECERKHAA